MYNWNGVWTKDMYNIFYSDVILFVTEDNQMEQQQLEEQIIQYQMDLQQQIQQIEQIEQQLQTIQMNQQLLLLEELEQQIDEAMNELIDEEINN